MNKSNAAVRLECDGFDYDVTAEEDYVFVMATEATPRAGFAARSGSVTHDGIAPADVAEAKARARGKALGECPRIEPDAARAAYDYLMKDRTANYGYDHRCFRRVSNQRSRARNAVKVLTENGRYPERLNWHAVGDRLTFSQNPNNGRWTAHYVVGQSQNEEITNLLRRLVNPDASWQS